MSILNCEEKSLLLNSVFCYLNNSNSFSKPLKRLLSAANIQDDSWKACPFNLEDVFNHYLIKDRKGKKKESKKRKRSEDIVEVGSGAKDGVLGEGNSGANNNGEVDGLVKKKKKRKKNSHLDENVDKEETLSIKDKKKKKKDIAEVGSGAKDGVLGEGNSGANNSGEGDVLVKKKKKRKKNSHLDENVDKEETLSIKDKKKKKKKKKDGAEVGSGAKDGVLGEVKGQDFHHEKTKKKKGSVKEIDLLFFSIGEDNFV